MPKETDRLKLPLPLGNENVTRESINGIFEKIDAGVATRESILIPAESDLNSYITEGEYYCPTNATVGTLANSPVGVAFHLTIEKHAGVVQTLTTFEPSNLQVFQRNYYVGWGPWKKVPTRDDIEQLQEDLQNADIPPASLTEPGIVQLSNATDGTSETLAATEKAVKLINDITSSTIKVLNEREGYGTTTNFGNDYSVKLTPSPDRLVEGLRITVKINATNSGTSTINVNELGKKSLLRANGTPLPSGSLKLNSVYTFVYNGTNFMLQGEGAFGNAMASDLLSGKTATSDAGDIVGTMQDHGAITFNIKDQNTSYKVPEGYHNGKGVVQSTYASGSTKGASGRVTVGPFIQGSVYSINQLISNLDFTPRHVIIKNSYSSNPVCLFSSVPPKSQLTTNFSDDNNYIRQLTISSVTPSSNSFYFSVYADFSLYQMTSYFTFDWSAWD